MAARHGPHHVAQKSTSTNFPSMLGGGELTHLSTMISGACCPRNDLALILGETGSGRSLDWGDWASPVGVFLAARLRASAWAMAVTRNCESASRCLASASEALSLSK